MAVSTSGRQELTRLLDDLVIERTSWDQLVEIPRGVIDPRLPQSLFDSQVLPLRAAQLRLAHQDLMSLGERTDQSGVKLASEASGKVALTALTALLEVQYQMDFVDQLQQSPVPAYEGPEPGFDAAELKASLEVRESSLMDLLQKSVSVDHAQYDGLKMVPAEVIATISDNLNAIVAIFWRPSPAAAPVFLGTGILYRDHVLSCAHLLTVTWSDGQQDFSRVMVLPYAARDLHATIAVDPARSRIWPTIDTACLGLVAGAERQALLDQALRARIDFSSTCRDESWGPVYALAAQWDVPRATVAFQWLPPGRIVLPHTIVMGPKPSAPNECVDLDLAYLLGENSSPDERLLRVLNAQIFKLLPLQDVADTMCAVLRAICKAYDGCSGDWVLGCGLRAATDARTNLSRFTTDEEFRMHRRTPCFGTDLPSVEGASGAPVFLVSSDKQKLIGLNAGIVGPMSQTQSASALDSFTRTIPFHVVRDAVDAFIDELAAK